MLSVGSVSSGIQGVHFVYDLEDELSTAHLVIINFQADKIRSEKSECLMSQG